MSDPSDTQLLAQAVEQQDPAAFAQLFDRFKHESFNLALHLTQNAALAEDAVQDAMLAVWQLKKIPESGARKWLLAIVAHKSLQTIRSRRRSSQREERIKGMSVKETPTAPDARQERDELIGALRSHMEKLPPVERQMLALYFGAEISESEIGKMLSLSQTSVSRKLSDALARLRSNLAAAGFAAAVPLVALKGLNQALLTGQQAPHSLSESVLNALKTNPRSPVSRRSGTARKAAKAGKSIGGPLFAATAFAVALGVASYASFSKPATTNLPVTTTATTVAPSPTGLRKFWSFNTGPAADLTAFHGTWTWTKHGETGGMDAPVDHSITVPLNMEIGAAPLLVETVWNGNGRTGAGCVDTLRTTGSFFPRYNEYVKSRRMDTATNTTRAYVIGKYIVSLHNTQVCSICEFPDAQPTDGLCLVTQNFAIESIAVRTLQPADIPAELRDIEAVIKQLEVQPAPGRNTGGRYRPD